MVKSGQRKKRLSYILFNFIREIVTLFFSISLWLYCLIAFILILGSFLQINHHQVLLLRMVLNIEVDTIFHILHLMSWFFITSVIIFTTSISIHKYKNRKEGINDGKFLLKIYVNYASYTHGDFACLLTNTSKRKD